jgi:hypothetical protein
MTKEYIEFYGNCQDILNGCSDVEPTIALFLELFKAYQPKQIEVTEVPQEDRYVPMPALDNKLHHRPF